MSWHRPRHTKGREAREQAERDLQATRERWPEVRALSESLRELRARNHFAEQLVYAMRREDRP